MGVAPCAHLANRAEGQELDGGGIAVDLGNAVQRKFE